MLIQTIRLVFHLLLLVTNMWLIRGVLQHFCPRELPAHIFFIYIYVYSSNIYNKQLKL